MALRGGFSRGRRLAQASEGLATTIAVVALVAAIVYAASRPALRRRLDLTEDRHYTLTEQTRQLVAGLDADVRFVSLMSPELQPVPNGLEEVQREAADYVHGLLREYVLASGGRVSLQILDPHADRAEVAALQQDLVLTRYNVVLVRGPVRTEQVLLEELVTIDRGLADPSSLKRAELVDVRSEGPLTSALQSVMHEEAPRVGVLAGYGGPQLEDRDLAGLFLLGQSLRLQGLEPLSLDVGPAGVLPADVGVVVVCGATRPLSAAALEGLEDFHRDGGGLLIALDPEHRDAGLDALLADLGLGRGAAVLCREDAVVGGERRGLLQIQRFFDHEVSAPIARQGLFATWPLGGALARLATAPAELQTAPLAASDLDVFGDLVTPGDFGDFVFGADEARGQHVVGFAVEGGSAGRAVVLASARAFTNAHAGPRGGPANLDLALNAVNWLAGHEDALAVRPRALFESRVDLTADESRRVLVYVLLLLPLGGALLGLLVGFARR